MSITTTQPAPAPATTAAPATETQSWLARVGAFVSLTKPRLSLLVLFVVFLGAWLAGGGAATWHAVIATALVAGGANALNMYMERDLDRLMRRTRGRPLPTGRLQPVEVLVFALALGAIGVTWLWLATTPLAAVLAAGTYISYALLYTPLKTRTTLNTHIGAIPGALPGLIGYAAVAGNLAPLPWALFWIVYLWQIPHFLSIAWIYRDDYERGGYRMLPAVDPDGSLTGRQSVVGAIAIIPVSLLPFFGGMAGPIYLAAALGVGGLYLARSIAFMHVRSEATARGLMRASLVYLPVLITALLIDYNV